MNSTVLCYAAATMKTLKSLFLFTGACSHCHHQVVISLLQDHLSPPIEQIKFIIIEAKALIFFPLLNLNPPPNKAFAPFHLAAHRREYYEEDKKV